MNRLYLASKSPRRSEILSKFNIELELVESQSKEELRLGEGPIETVMALAFEKAHGSLLNLEDGDLVLAADTILYFEGEILGKPRDREDAFRMLKALSARSHRVITGVSILKKGYYPKIVDYSETLVEFKKLEDEDINRYLDTEEYVDKAGAYGIQGFGSVLIDSIEGCYFNVVGLPISKVSDLLKEHFNFKLI